MGLSSKAAVLDYLKAAERVDAYAAALKARARVALAGVESSSELVAEIHVEKELAIATRSSQYSAGMAIERARVLTATFPSFLTALAAGEISEGHCRELVERTRTCTDPAALAAVERVTLPKAKRMTPKQFGNQVAKAIADYDPDAASRYRRAREQRSVWTRELEDGMSYLGMVHDTSTITAIKATLDADAYALRAQRRTAADEVRDTAIAAGEDGDAAVWSSTDPRRPRRRHRRLRRRAHRGVPRRRPRRPHPRHHRRDRRHRLGSRSPPTSRCSSSSTWQTLRGEADRHCLLDGQPVPAQIGRELAGYASAFRRMVTDPVDGHLLDYGTLTYLPAPLRTYVLARDGGCRAPGCTSRDPRRLQMDHATPFPDGASDTGQHRRHLHLRPPEQDRGFARIENSKPDGSCDWVTAWGQRVHIPASPFLHDPADIPDPDPPPPLEEPPF